MSESLLIRVVRLFRRRRMRRFIRTFNVRETTRILDVGGTPLNWEMLAVRPRVTLLNIPAARVDWPGFDCVIADGRALPLADRSFDIVFSNSVIEHVGQPASQVQFANELRRVGCQYWVQTPNRRFPVEPHLLTPFLHFLPHRWQCAIARKWTVWRFVAVPSRPRRDAYIEHFLDDIRLLDSAGLRRLFPDGTIRNERFLGWTKSLVAHSRSRP